MRKKNGIRIWAVVLSLAILLGITACANTEKDWREQYDLGMRYLSEGDYEEAILAFSAAIEIDDSRPEAYMARAEAYIAIDEPEKALKDYKRARKVAKADDDYEDLVEDLEGLIDELEDWIDEHDDDRESEGSGDDWPLSDDWGPAEDDASAFEITVTDAYSDYVTGYYYGDYAYCYHIPRINLENDLAAETNQEIYDTLWARLEGSLYSSLDNYGYPSIGNVAYCWGMKDDVLSVVVEESGAEYHWTGFYVYNISIETGRQISDEELLTAFGLDMDSFYELASEVLLKNFETSYTEREIEGMGRDLYDSLVADTLSEENMSKIRPYVGENGGLCMTAGVYCPAGAGYYLHAFDLKQQTMLAGISCSVDHTTVDDAPTGYTAEEITAMVADWYNNNLDGYENGNFAAFDSETYISDGKCCVVVRFQNMDPEYTGGANTLVTVAEVDMTTGEMWADGYYRGDLW